MIINSFKYIFGNVKICNYMPLNLLNIINNLINKINYFSTNLNKNIYYNNKHWIISKILLLPT